jgi:hypothetical protein
MGGLSWRDGSLEAGRPMTIAQLKMESFAMGLKSYDKKIIKIKR